MVRRLVPLVLGALGCVALGSCTEATLEENVLDSAEESPAGFTVEADDDADRLIIVCPYTPESSLEEPVREKVDDGDIDLLSDSGPWLVSMHGDEVLDEHQVSPMRIDFCSADDGDPIDVDADHEFSVSSGDGTAEDPYVVEP